MEGAYKLLYEACKEFVRKVEAGEARSVKSYAQMKKAIEAADMEQLPDSLERVQRKEGVF